MVVVGGVLLYEHWTESELKEQERAAGAESRAALKRLHDRETAEAKSKAAVSVPQKGQVILEDEDANDKAFERRRQEDARASGIELGTAEGGSNDVDTKKPPSAPTPSAPKSKNRGVEWVRETPTTKDPVVLDYQSTATGARSDIATRTPEVPALRFDNPNPRGVNRVRFDGLEENVLIDRKWSVTSKSKQERDLLRMGEALRQNPEYTGRIEVPTQSEANRARRILDKLGIDRIDVRVVPPPSH